MIAYLPGKKFRFLIFLILFFGICNTVFPLQTRISGIINHYGRVTGIGTDNVTISDPVQLSDFTAGDTVLLIQMKGIRIYTIDASSYGTAENIYGKPGNHEFLIVNSVNVGTKKITFTNNIINTFDINGALQLVKIPYYNSAIVDGSGLTCSPWDSTSKTGGVLALTVGRTLALNNNIDVSGKGFTGGAVTLGTGLCTGSDPSNLDKYFFNSSLSNSGYKGDSPVSRGWFGPDIYPPIYPDYFKGKGSNFTGGGGGSGRFSGGGGGSNYGVGGKGGLEIAECFPTYIRADGGRGGLQIKLTPLDGGIFMGGGGGSSTYLTGSTPTPGGNGGGIVIIICDEIIGNGNSIIADGATTSPLQAGSNAGAGGGGGGGSVALYLQTFSTSPLTISANGGQGGNNTGTFGEGGGGGGGLIKINNISIPGNVTRTVAFGGHGTRLGSFTAGDGTVGENITDFVALLNGFLFNSIRSSVTGDQIDNISSGLLPPKITGTKPLGGTPPFTYLWEKSYDEITWIPLTNDADPTSYIPTSSETSTVYFRRTITDSSVPTLIDISRPVKVIVSVSTNLSIEKSEKSVVIYPNPAYSSIELRLKDQRTGKVAISLFNSSGQKVTSITVEKPDEIFTYIIPVYNLARGTYFYQVFLDSRFIDSGEVVLLK